jgi:ABC-type transport system involved in multi-copper enzyme maturation permease subunit
VPGAWFGWFEATLARFGDRLNPILVKEARQALKSRQFTVTFILVLVAGWCWSIIGIAWMGPSVYWSSNGPSMFFGYFMILAFPLLVIVPFGAYRSLSDEREDRTYELLSITTLRPRQIVAGKLAGASLQMLVYLSAISPCLAFTYLLRGLDIVTIGTILVYLVLGSLGLSMLCLLLATSATVKFQQAVTSVGLVLGLMLAFYGACIVVWEMLSFNSGIDSQARWIANAALLTAYLSYFAMCFLAAAAELSFVGSNRSTALRIVLVVQQALFLGWMSAFWFAIGTDDEVLKVAALISGLHWFAMGAFMTGEPRQLSPRVMRDLPRSFLGRAFLTWFNPGPATGYMLAVASYLAAILVICAAYFTDHHLAGNQFSQVVMVCALGLSYVAVYLGVGRWLLGVLERYGPIAPATRLLVYACLLFLGTVTPLTVQMSIPQYRNDGYTVLQATNPFWTMAEAMENTPAFDTQTAAMILGVAAVVVFVLNLPAVAEEVLRVRIAAPGRVAEEDAEIAAAITPHVHVKTNPWDEE